MKSFIIISVLVVLGATGTWLVKSPGASDTGSIANRDTLPVQTQVLTPIESITRERQFSGTIVAARRSRLAFQRSARLVSVLVDQGDVVKEGDKLAVIDQRQLLTQVAQLKAQLSQQKAVLAELNAGPRQETVAAMQAELQSVTADVDLRLATLKRTEKLFERKVTTAQDLDESRLAWKSLGSKREAVKKRLDELLAGTRQEQVDAQQAMVAGLEAQLASLNIDVADSTLQAPFGGTIVRRLADEGDMLTAQQPVFELLETGRMEAQIGIPSAMVKCLDSDDYHVLSVGQVEVTAKLRSVVSQVDATTRTQNAVFDIDDSQTEQLADGQLVRLNFDEPVAVDGFEVPLTALASGSRGLWTLYVIDADTPDEWVVSGRAVEVLHTTGDRAVIRGSVFADEKFVADGVHRVVPGQRVIDARTMGSNADDAKAEQE